MRRREEVSVLGSVAHEVTYISMSNEELDEFGSRTRRADGGTQKRMTGASKGFQKRLCKKSECGGGQLES